MQVYQYFINRSILADSLWPAVFKTEVLDPFVRRTVTVGSDHCFCTCRPSVPTFQNLAKQNKAKIMFPTGETVDLAE